MFPDLACPREDSDRRPASVPGRPSRIPLCILLGIAAAGGCPVRAPDAPDSAALTGALSSPAAREPISTVQGTVFELPAVQFEVSVYEGEVPLRGQLRALTANGAPLPEGEYCWTLGEQTDCGPVSTHHTRSFLIERSGTYAVALTLTLAGLATPIGCTTADERAPEVTARAPAPAPEPAPGPTPPGNAVRREPEAPPTRPAGGLVVTPDRPFTSSGGPGEAFEPLSTTYRLRNSAGTPIEWTARHTQPWLTLSRSGGSLDPGETADLVVTLGSEAHALPPGDHSDEIVLTNTTDGAGDTVRHVTVTVRPVQWATRVSQYGITWIFDRGYQVGRFVNGDWWVCGDGPENTVTVVSVDPAPAQIVQTDLSGSNPRTFWVDGSARNPVWATQSYDERIGTFAIPPKFPLVLSANDSLVSTVSWRKGEPGCPVITQSKPYAPRPSLKRAAVLTCLKKPPAEPSFRPPYIAGPKPLIPSSRLKLDRLPHKRPPASAPGTAEAASARLVRLWLDHLPTWANRYMHPSENMRDYGRDFASDFNVAGLYLLLDVPDPAKRLVASRCVQIGIDMYHVLERGGSWGTDGGGHGVGRKWPILLAGLLLDDADMKAIGAAYPCSRFQEDCQTFYVTQEYLDLHTRLKHTFHLEWQVGSAQWGERHCSRPESDDKSRSYRDCCTNGAWCGAALSALLLDARGMWNWEAFFDETDAWMAEFVKPGTFAYDMWLMYRQP